MRNTILKAMAAACVGAALAACSEETTSPAPAEVAGASSNLSATEPENFSIQAPLDAFFINQMPEMMIRSNERRDFAIQQLVTHPSTGAWHTHPGPSFGIVKQGRVMITRWTRKGGCVSTIYGPGQAYFEVANEVHRATVLEPEVAVEYKARFYVPVGGKFGENLKPEDVPNCS